LNKAKRSTIIALHHQSGRSITMQTLHGVLIATLALAGCSLTGESAHIYPGLFGQNVVGNETYVTVSNVYNEIDALPLAETHCGKYGRSARFNHMERIRAIFDCVPRQ
jgi:hypothetical protein